jgi:hypothetical protein
MEGATMTSGQVARRLTIRSKCMRATSNAENVWMLDPGHVLIKLVLCRGSLTFPHSESDQIATLPRSDAMGQ